MQQKVAKLRKWCDLATANRRALEARSKGLRKDYRTVRMEKQHAEMAAQVFARVGAELQNRRISHIRSIVIELVRPVLGSEYEDFIMEYTQQRNTPNVVFYLVKDGIRIRVPSASGSGSGGERDLVAWALKIALWATSPERTLPLFFFDEPFKFLSPDKLERLVDVLGALCARLGIQVIMVTHDPLLAELADGLFVIASENGESVIKSRIVS